MGIPCIGTGRASESVHNMLAAALRRGEADEMLHGPTAAGGDTAGEGIRPSASRARRPERPAPHPHNPTARTQDSRPVHRTERETHP